MAIVSSTQCCGMKELSEISLDISPEDTIRSVLPRIYKSCGLVIFTGVLVHGYGKRLADYIEKHKLGQVRQSLPRTNPNTNNRIAAWIWSVSTNGCRDYMKRHRL